MGLWVEEDVVEDNNFMHVFNRPRHKRYLQDNSVDYWEDTVFAGYTLLNTKQKGIYGEMVVSDIMEDVGYIVHRRRNSGHDLVIDGHTTEVKFSLSQSDQKTRVVSHNTFTINHVATHKKWSRLIFYGVNINFQNVSFWFTKEDFVNVLCGKFFKRQQGGEDGKNDDFMCTDRKVMALSKSSYVRSLREW